MAKKAKDTKEVVKYDITTAEIEKMKSVYMDLVITDLKDEDQFNSVKDARLVVKGKRCAVENRRKELKADALAWGKKVDTEANRIKGLLEPIETHLQNEENKVIEEQKRNEAEEKERQRKITQGRIDELLKVECVMPFMEVATLTDEEYADLLQGKTQEWEAEQEKKAKEVAERKAEEERLAKQKAEQDAFSAALKKQADDLAAQQKAIQDEKNRIEAEKRVEQERKAKEKFEKETRERIEREAKEKIERESREKEEAEKRAAEKKAKKAEMRPDKDKAYDFANAISDIPTPEVKSDEVRELLAWASNEVKDLSGLIKIKIDDL